jgi:hypothetical protein
MSGPGVRPSVDFEPAGVLPARSRRRPDPVVVTIALVVIGLAIAVLKPWGTTSESATVTPTGPPTASSETSVAPLVEPGDRAIAAAIGAAFRPHDGWGVAVITAAVGRDSLTAFRERWWPATPGVPAGASPLALSAAGVVALGITSPRRDTPLDVRAFYFRPDVGWQWLDVAPAPARDAAALALLPPTVPGVKGAPGAPGPS